MEVPETTEEAAMPTGRFPILDGLLDENDRGRLAKALAEMDAALAQGSIANARYAAVKDEVNWQLARAWKKRTDQLAKEGARLNPFLSAGSFLYAVQVANAAATIKKLRRLPGRAAPELLALAEEVKPLADAVIRLKGIAVKRQRKVDGDGEAASAAPVASSPATELVKARLEEITQAQRDNLVAFYRVRYQSWLDSFMAAADKQAEAARDGRTRYLTPFDHFSIRYMTNVEAVRVVGACVAQRDHWSKASLRPDAAARLGALAAETADALRAQFVCKNLAKVGGIVDAKGNLQGVQVVGHAVDLAGMTGTLAFSFADGSGFTVALSVIVNTSINGKEFNQFPLRFSRVTLPDGSTMALPSEKKMNEVFAAAVRDGA